ncbi:MAG: peptidylprolyl isomerase [Myxococcales bacterium]|nr:peptidylprolyl isomerase [Myxococcales bacterium]|tara:strand:- start:1218 stop:1706 length:489 start_codon:yes stop_codon:yes gene_type:complete
MSDASTVDNGKIVRFHYTLTNDAGEQLDSSRESTPLAYLHGANNIVPGLERHMRGHQAGDKFVAVVGPSEGYGEYQEPGPQPVERSAFPEDAQLFEGATFSVQAGTGDVFPVWITKVEDDTVYVDANHPLAGVTLHFDVEIVDIRDASEEEMTQGHPSPPAA